MVLGQQEQSDKLIEEFGRQILVPGIDEAGQLNISKKKVCIIGLGALGTVASQYLVRAGVGEIHLIDHDKIEKSNLHRQINYDLNDIGKSKSKISKHKLKSVNNTTIIKEHSLNFESFIEENPKIKFDLIFDCTDNHQNKIFSSKFFKYVFSNFNSGLAVLPKNGMQEIPNQIFSQECRCKKDSRNYMMVLLKNIIQSYMT